MIPALDELLDALHRFAEAIGIETQELQQHETPKKLRYTNTAFPVRMLRDLEQSSITEMQSRFGSSLSLRCSLADLPVLRIDGNDTATDLDTLRDETDSSTSVNIVFEIDKQALVQSWGLNKDSQHAFSLFFYSVSLERELESGLSDPRQLEQSLWSDSPCQAVALVADRSVMLTGTFIAILGNRETARLETLPAINSDYIESEKQTHDTCRDAVRWEHRWTDFLTPRYFDFSADPESLEEQSVRLFSANGVNIGLLFTADRIRNLSDGFIAAYSEASSSCEVRSLTTDEVDDKFSIVGADVTRGLAAWAYDERWRTDRLRLLQVALTRVLSRNDSPYSCQRLLGVAVQLEQEVQWHWKTFISDAVESYVTEETELENEIAETVDGYESQVSSMIASLSGTMLAAVGVMIGSFIAAAFKTKFNATIFAFGIIGYMVYLVLFPGVYNMLHHLIRYRTMNEIFDKRTQRFMRLLGTEATQAIIGEHVSRAQGRFCRWFIFTIVALVVVLILAGLAAWFIPSHVQATEEETQLNNVTTEIETQQISNLPSTKVSAESIEPVIAEPAAKHPEGEALVSPVK
ncbi:hypothetical protein SAMN06265222_101650 [Neorhodopirellula lusitana]|uniref:Uncharacterized protein n=1 Tax=Neorhodopirellula lusitana TaxID=445327 RepID=A0ABY1PQY9_9BACT|nr:hypothetical protein [Neorhodopirellula lusitana]SMP41756.1 hypothetical protein SAMN06265222_101650 [Neorhodopirellula lusitana]